MAHLKRLQPDDKIPLIAEAMGFLALVTRETPAEGQILTASLHVQELSATFFSQVAGARIWVELGFGGGVLSVRGSLLELGGEQIRQFLEEFGKGLQKRVTATAAPSSTVAAQTRVARRACAAGYGSRAGRRISGFGISGRLYKCRKRRGLRYDKTS